MDTKIFLQKFADKKSTSTSNSLNVEFKGKRKLLPSNDIYELVSLSDQYSEEREKCSTIRLTCQVNTICSNVLFNKVTEIVKDEGSSAVTFINYGLNPNGDDETFGNVLYKPMGMSFWSGSTTRYQAIDGDVSGETAVTTRTCDISSTTHFSNGVMSSSTISHPTNSIRDTQLSKENIGFKYHCGLDIFNNHLIRSNTFKSVCKCPDNLNSGYTAFNTIADLMRNVNGDKTLEKVYFPTSEESLRNRHYTKVLSLHLYTYDDVLTFNKAVEERLIKKYNGWLGFYNNAKIKNYENFSASTTSMEIERPISYINGGDFVDMYPSRDLYSFVPKYNAYQNRIEKNWNYVITYPSSSYTPSSNTDSFSDIIESNDGLNSLKAIYFSENTRADNGISQLVIYGISKHGLSVGDYVNIYRTYDTMLYWVAKVSDGNNVRVSIEYESQSEAEDAKGILEIEDPSGEYVVLSSDSATRVNRRVIDSAEVADVVDDYIFTVYNSTTQISDNWIYLSDSEISNGVVERNGLTYRMDVLRKFMTTPSKSYRYYIVNERYVNLDDNSQMISYKKTYGGVECDYYIRIFSKLPNFKYASGGTSSEYEIYENNGAIITQYQDSRYDFESHVGKLAFAKNIYSDEIGEIVFTDDIDISKLHDNLGRPLTSIYLTIIKNNKGYKEWYGWECDNTRLNNWSSDAINNEFQNIEFSHCFGPVTCGIKVSDESTFDASIRSINRINNVIDEHGYNIGYDISQINGDRYYLSNSMGTINIGRHEIWSDSDKNFYGDLCCYDYYNANEMHIDYINHRFNTAQRESYGSRSGTYFNDFIYDEIRNDDYDARDEFSVEPLSYLQNSNDRSYSTNALREGYYYNPHYEIPIRTFGKLNAMFPDFLTIRQFRRNSVGNYTFTTLQQHFLSVGDKSTLYDALQDKYYVLVTNISNDDNYRVFTCNVYDEDKNELVDITYLNAVGEERTINILSTEAVLEGVKVFDFKLFKMDNLDAPSYAKVIKDGTCRVIWRDVINNGFDSSNPLEEYPFTNGAFYVNKQVNLFVRRQDPNDIYGIYNRSDISGEIIDYYATEDNFVKDTEIEC